MKPWSEARTFAELCEINIRFIRGELSGSPSHGPIDPETNEIEDYLVQLNRNGFLTTQSQPAADGPHGRQRAWVEGFASGALALQIGAKELYSDLRVEFFPVASIRLFWMPISQEEGRARAWQGTIDPKSDDLLFFETVCRAEAMDELRNKWYVTAIDRVWGRKSYMWDLLLEPPREGYAVVPRPDDGADDHEE